MTIKLVNSSSPDVGFVDDGIDDAVEILRKGKGNAVAVATVVVYADGDRQYSYTTSRHNGKAALIGRLLWLANKVTGDLK